MAIDEAPAPVEAAAIGEAEPASLEPTVLPAELSPTESGIAAEIPESAETVAPQQPDGEFAVRESGIAFDEIVSSAESTEAVATTEPAPPARDIDFLASPPPPPPPEPFEQAPRSPILPEPDVIAMPAAAEQVIPLEDDTVIEVETPADEALVAPEPPEITPTAGTADEGPAVVIPSTRDERQILAEIPQPISGERDSASPAIPRPIGMTESTAAADVREPESATAEEAPRAVEPAAELHPIDGRRFENPGLLGQGTQLVLLAATGVAVAMILALTLLNNRLDSYATSGEGLVRVESAESLINTWLRPLLVLSVLGGYALLVYWARRVQNNIAMFNRFVPETAMWMWLIPIGNVWALHRHFDNAWKGADVDRRGGEDWQRGRPEWWNVAFTILVVVAFVVIVYAGLFRSADSFEAAIDANAWSMIGYGLLAASLLSAVKAVGIVIERQEDRVKTY